MRSRILVVEDDRSFLKCLKVWLETASFGVIPCASAPDALLHAIDSKPDLVLSDVNLGGMSGVDLCRQLKKDPRTSTIPIVLMSGTLKEDEEQAEGLDSGADDYLLKPVSGQVLVAKLRAVIRRYASPVELEEVLRAEGLVLDVQARTVAVKGRAVRLTRKEFDLLTTLLAKRGRVLRPAFLLEAVWGVDPAADVNTRTLVVHISSLRSKIGDLADRIVAVSGVGYRFEA